jgi:hypothetical protein
LAAWGEPSRPGFPPEGETGKGAIQIPCCRRLITDAADPGICRPPSTPQVLTATQKPEFPFKDALSNGGITALQFVALMSIIANETRGNFVPVTEVIGIIGHRGLAYPFDRIPNLKKSYNANSALGNRTAFECFNNQTYINAHGSLLPPAGLVRTSDAVWQGEVYPQASAPLDPRTSVSGFIMEADFMKFRGRRLIQTTGRSNYLALIRFVQQYNGLDSTILAFKTLWSGKTGDQAAFESTNADWERLFQQTDLEIATAAIQAHNRASGNYFKPSSDAAVLNGSGRGSLTRMGLRIGGASGYTMLFFERAAAVLHSLPEQLARRSQLSAPPSALKRRTKRTPAAKRKRP